MGACACWRRRGDCLFVDQGNRDCALAACLARKTAWGEVMGPQ